VKSPRQFPIRFYKETGREYTAFTWMELYKCICVENSQSANLLSRFTARDPLMAKERICSQIKSNHWWQFNTASQNDLKGKTWKTSLYAQVSFDLWMRSPADNDIPNWGELIFIDFSFSRSLNKAPKWVCVCGVLSFAVYLEKCGWGFLKAV